MKLYHISPDTDFLGRLFEPRVPRLSKRAEEIEDVVTPRICFSESVSGCISAMPKYSRNQVAVVGGRFILYEIDTKDFSEEDFVSNEMLVRRKAVYDANITKEWWLLKPVFLQGTLCEIVSVKICELPEAPLLPDIRAWNYQIEYLRLKK